VSIWKVFVGGDGGWKMGLRWCGRVESEWCRYGRPL